MQKYNDDYYIAAENLSNGFHGLACVAVYRVRHEYDFGAFDPDYVYVKLLEAWFKPTQVSGSWYAHTENGENDWAFSPFTEQGRLGRSLMLLFMHEIYMDELKKQGPKKGAVKKWSDRLQEIGNQPPPEDLMKILNTKGGSKTTRRIIKQGI